VRLLLLVLAVAVVASANAAGVRKLRGWQVTHITMTTTMSDQLTNAQLEVCDNGEVRVIAATTTSRIDVHPTRMHWWAIYYPNVRRVLPYGAPGMRAKAANETTLTWGIPVDVGDTCTIQTKICTRKRTVPGTLLYSADPYPVSRGLVWVWWKRWHSAMWEVDFCIPPGVPTGHLYHDLPRDGGDVHYRYARRDCRDCGLDPLTRTRYSMWFRAAKFHFRMSGSGALTQRRGFSAMSGTYSYRLDTAVRQIFN
jgi:hypothetical protein